MRTILFATLLATVSVPAFAQTTYINPNPLTGDYTITRPGTGMGNSYVRQNPLTGGYTVTTPGSGRPPVYIDQNPLTGGYTIKQRRGF